MVDVCDFVAGYPNAVSGLSAKVCDKRDMGCQQPLQTGFVDEAGRLSLQVPTERAGFDRYVTIQPPAVSCAGSEILEAKDPLSEPPVTANLEEPIAVPLFKTRDFSASVSYVAMAPGLRLRLGPGRHDGTRWLIPF